MTGLNIRAIGWLLVLLVAMGALLFLPAWTFNYWQAWIFLGVFGLSSLAVTVYLMKNDPRLLERRMHGGPAAEKELSQKIIMTAGRVRGDPRRSGARSPLALVRRSSLRGDRGKHSDRARMDDHPFRVQGKYVYLGYHRGDG